MEKPPKPRKRFPWSKIPLTIRFCCKCKAYRYFEFNPSLGHSECVECGCRLSLKQKPKDNDWKKKARW